MVNGSVLIVEDSFIVALHMRTILVNAGYNVVDIKASGEEALQLIQKQVPDLILMDIALNGEMDGIETTLQIHQILTVPVIFITAQTDEPTYRRAMNAGPFAYITKPFQEEKLLQLVAEALLHKLG